MEIPLRVGFVGRYPPTHCGVAEYTRMLATFLESMELGIEIEVFSTTESFEEPYIERESGVKVYPCFKHRGTDFRNCLNMLSYTGGVDILHIQHEYGIFGETNSVLRFAEEAKENGLTRVSVITMHTVYHPYSLKDFAINFQLNLKEYVDLVIVHSRLQEFELNSQGLPLRMIARIPHGTLLNPYLGMPKNKLLKSLGVKLYANRPLLVLPGFVRKDKGIDTLLKATSKVNKRLIILVAGELKDEELLSLLTSDRDILYVHRYLSNEEILKAVAAADSIVLPYRDKPGTYSVSGILHLSMGALKPIIGSRVPRLIELYENARRLTTNPEDPLSLAEKIEWVLKHYDYAVVYASNLYSYAVRVQWARMARRHLLNYNRLLHRELRI